MRLDFGGVRVINKYRYGSYSTFQIIAVTAIIVCLVLICLMGAAIYYLVNNPQPGQGTPNGAAAACPTCSCSASQITGAMVTAPSFPSPAPLSSPASPASAAVATAPAEFTNIKNLSGTGSQSTATFDLKSGTVKIKWKNAGGGNFIVQLINARDGTVEHIANENGSTEGQNIIFHANANLYLLDITSNGDWNISVDWMP